MAETFTPNLNLSKPDIGGNDNVWGDKLNADMDKIDATYNATGLGTVVRRKASNAADLGAGGDLTSAAGIGRIFQWFTGTALRWVMGANGTAEGGADAGSDFQIIRYNDAGTAIDAPILITRSTGVVALTQVPTAAGSAVVTQATLATASGALSEPVGTVKMYVGNTDPPPVGGVQYYMLCDGRPLAIASYPALVAIIGTQFGGSGSNFNLPNTAEHVIVGKSTTQSLIPQFDCRAMGNSFGEGRHTQLPGEMAAHVHTIAAHHHGLSYSQFQAGGSGTNFVTGIGAGAATAQTADTPLTSDSFGSASPMNVVQPSLVMNFIIRVQ